MAFSNCIISRSASLTLVLTCLLSSNPIRSTLAGSTYIATQYTPGKTTKATPSEERAQSMRGIASFRKDRKNTTSRTAVAIPLISFSKSGANETETSAHVRSLLPVSTDGSCGAGAGKICTPGNCCSQWGWCGATSGHCGLGCQAGYGNCDGAPAVSSPPAASSPIPSGPSTGLFYPSPGSYNFPRMNTLSKYASWVKQSPSSADLRNRFVPAKSQGSCGSCWAFAAVASMEGIYNTLYQPWSPVALSEQELIDCGASTPGGCSGGWPSQGLDWVANNWQGIAKTSDYGAYTSGAGSCKSWTGGVTTVLRYEKVAPYDEEMLKAVANQQPVIAFMTLADNFQNWNSWNIYSDAEGQCIEDSELTHVVTIVGYGKDNGVDYWIVRNSFGTGWGYQGHARVKRIGGRGVCGLTSAPMIYPIIKRTWDSQCSSPNPCGRGTCVVPWWYGSSYYCASCPEGYVVTANTDGSSTCALVDVCNTGGLNPCGPGACTNEGDGRYHCNCYLGYVASQYSDGNPTCFAPYAISGAAQTYTVRSRDTCYLIATAFGLTLQKLLDNNVGDWYFDWWSYSWRRPTLNCNSLQINQVVNVGNGDATTCKVLYAIQKDDSCWKIEDLFGIPHGQLASQLNPGLVCDPTYINGYPAGIQPGQQVCVQRGTPDTSKICSSLYTVTASDAAQMNCGNIFSRVNVDKITFFELNRGINCANLYAGQQVCADYQIDSPTGGKYFYYWQGGDTCWSVTAAFCGTGPKMSWKSCFKRSCRNFAVGTKIRRKTCIGANGRGVSNCGW